MMTTKILQEMSTNLQYTVTKLKRFYHVVKLGVTNLLITDITLQAWKIIVDS